MQFVLQDYNIIKWMLSPKETGCNQVQLGYLVKILLTWFTLSERVITEST